MQKNEIHKHLNKTAKQIVAELSGESASQVSKVLHGKKKKENIQMAALYVDQKIEQMIKQWPGLQSGRKAVKKT